MPELHHPDLDVTRTVTDRQARVLARSGWVPAGDMYAQRAVLVVDHGLPPVDLDDQVGEDDEPTPY